MSERRFILEESSYLELFLLGAWFRWPIDEDIEGDLRRYTTVGHVMKIMLSLLGYQPQEASNLVNRASRTPAYQNRFRRFGNLIDTYANREGRLEQIRSSPALFLHGSSMTKDTNWRIVLLSTRIFLTRAGAVRASKMEERYADLGVTYNDYIAREVQTQEYFGQMDPARRMVLLANYRERIARLVL